MRKKKLTKGPYNTSGVVWVLFVITAFHLSLRHVSSLIVVVVVVVSAVTVVVIVVVVVVVDVVVVVVVDERVNQTYSHVLSDFVGLQTNLNIFF
jgi:hypothetical protein